MTFTLVQAHRLRLERVFGPRLRFLMITYKNLESLEKNTWQSTRMDEIKQKKEQVLGQIDDYVVSMFDWIDATAPQYENYDKRLRGRPVSAIDLLTYMISN